ncbi:MAG: hypothetical protein RLZZ230_908 [Candidatus Parcubacteria bacterium]|jgi:ABC-type bacteriocin/lantibiotic exporter with double-glycine peptidase domain
MKALPVPYLKQDTDYTCGPTSLQMVLEYYGAVHSEAKLARQMQTSSEMGTCPLQMQEIALKHGFYCYVNKEASYEEMIFLLSLGVPPIVRFIEPDENEDHYSVVVAANKDKITINDPWNGPEQEFSKTDFIKRWTSNMIVDCNQWLMAVSPDLLPLGKQFHPYG